MSGNGGSISSLGLHVGNDWHVTCHHYTDQTPILRIDAGEASLLVSLAGRDATDKAVEFARTLVRKAQEFTAEVERLHAAQAAPSESDDSADRAA